MVIKKIFSIKSFYTTILFIIIASLALAILRSIFNENWIVLFISILVLVLSTIPILIRKKTKLKVPLEIELIAVLFIYATLFLGEVYDFYETFYWWDTLLHAGSAIVFGFIGFTVLYIMYSRHEVEAKPIAIAIFSFSFAIAIGAIWEIFEFSMDQFFGLNMQKSGLIDTMGDLIVDTVGAILASGIGLIYLKTKKSLIFDGIVRKMREENPELFKDRKTARETKKKIKRDLNKTYKYIGHKSVWQKR